jgi:hypothetical protein
MEDALFLVSGAEAPGGEESGTNRLKQSAASILTGSSFELPELPSGERALLEALGYIDPSRRDP